MDSAVLTRVTGRSVGPDLDKAASGIPGLDQILSGGLPRDRVTLVAGAAGAAGGGQDAARDELPGRGGS